MPEVIVTLYAGAGIVRATEESVAILRALPSLPIVMLHAAGSDVDNIPRAAAMLGAAFPPSATSPSPPVRLWVGLGVDGIGADVVAGRLTHAQAVAEFVRRAQIAHSVGAEVVVWDAEQTWKRENDPRGILPSVARDALDAVMREVPILQGFTGHGIPTLHASFPWEAFVGPSSPVVVHLPQQYAVLPDPHATAIEADVIERARRSDEAIAQFVASGRIRADLGPGGRGFGRYLMAYRQTPSGLVRVASGDGSLPSPRYVAFWAAPWLPSGRMDNGGFDAIATLLRDRSAQSTDGAKAVLGGATVGMVLLALWKLIRG